MVFAALVERHDSYTRRTAWYTSMGLELDHARALINYLLMFPTFLKATGTIQLLLLL